MTTHTVLCGSGTLSGVSSTGRRTTLLLGVLVVGSAAIRLVASNGATIPWITPDEVVYALTGESLWEHGTLTIRGLAAPYTSLLTPAIVGAPIAALGLDGGIGVAQALQSLVMATAAIPVFLWARRLTSQGWAGLAAVLTLLVPGLAYGGLLMTEAAFYPFAIASLATGTLVLERPTLLRQGAFFGLVTLAATVRMQALVLVPALLLAAVVHARITRSWSVARALAPIGVLALVGGIGVATAVAAGSGSLWESLLGAYQPVVQTSTSTLGVIGAIGVHAVGVALVSLALPLVGSVVVCVDALPKRVTGPRAAYAAIAVGYVPLLVLQVAAFSAQNVGYLSQRYLLTAAPVLFVGFAAWLGAGAPRPRRVVGVTVAFVVFGAALAPVDDLVPGTGVQDALWTTWLQGTAAESQWAARGVLVAVAAALLAVLLAPRRRLPAACAVVVVAGLAAVSVDATRTVVRESDVRQTLLAGAADPTWIASRYAPVTLLATGDHPPGTVARTFFWNEAVRSTVRLPDVDVTVPPSPPVVEIGRDGVVRATDGSPLVAQSVLTPATLTLAGALVEQRLDPEAQVPGWRLWRVAQPVRVTTRVIGALPNGDFTGKLTVLAPGCGQGALELTLLGKSGDPISVTVDGIPWGELEAPDGVVVRARVPAPPYANADHTCVYALATDGYTGSTRIEYVAAG